ncbi:hypothetical protein FQN51_002840, partial [Onygenales sp. PD_10]
TVQPWGNKQAAVEGQERQWRVLGQPKRLVQVGAAQRRALRVFMASQGSQEGNLLSESTSQSVEGTEGTMGSS